MPKWGLNQDLANTQPWGLDPRLLLQDKTNTDPIHEEIYLNVLERKIVDSPAFQRLRRVRQLGTTHLVYPGATHTRFQHSLGTLRVAQDLFDNILDNPFGDDLFAEWRLDPETFDKQVAEAMVLARLGALLHDFCHVPYGHTLEDDFELLTPHDKNQDRFNWFWSMIDEVTRSVVSSDLKRDLERLILSKNNDINASRYPFVSDLVGNTICADLIDYLARDFYYTGLPGRLGQRFLSYFFVTSSDVDAKYRHRMALRIEKKGRLRADVISEVFKYLRYRYELSERVLQHHAKVSADTMVAKAIEIWIAREGREAVENALRLHSDDGLLEFLAAKKLDGASDLALQVRDRNLYKEHRRSHADPTYLRRAALYETWRASQFRASLEERVADAVGLSAPWLVLVSIPNPKMRLKAAEVLVSWSGTVTPLREWDRTHGGQATEISESHERLWAVQLFVHPSLSQDERDRAAAYVSEGLGIVVWDMRPTLDLAGPVEEQAILELGRDRHLSDLQKQELRAAVHRAPKGRPPTFRELKDRLERTLAPTAGNEADPATEQPKAPGG
jgi:HD superfamily phosphohydrolase